MLVSPRMNHSSSWMIERRCSFLVVTSGKPSAQVEAHLPAEDRERAGARPVVLAVAVLRAHGASDRDIASWGGTLDDPADETKRLTRRWTYSGASASGGRWRAAA